MADDGGSLFVFIGGRLVNYLNARPTHWSERHEYNARWRQNVLAILLSKRATYPKGSPESKVPKRIHLHAIVPKRFDSHDGLRAALKPAVDGLQDAGIIHSDADGCGHVFDYSQVLGRRQPGVEIGIRLA